MILNIRRPHKHDYHVRVDTITEYGAEYLCHKCLDTDYMLWTTATQILRVKIYLILKKSAVLAKRLDN